MLIFVGFFLFCIGLLIVVSRTNAILVLMGLELMLSAAMLNFIFFTKTADSHLLVLLIMVVAAAEITIALALVFKIYRHVKHINLNKIVKPE